MKKIFKALTSAALCGCMLIPFPAFAADSLEFTDEEVAAANSNLQKAVSYLDGTNIMGDWNSDGELTASDARSILRTCAGLEDSSQCSDYAYRCDMNGNGSVTPADARLALRISAGLESSNITYLNAFNAMVNWVKPNNPISTRAAYRNVLTKKQYDNTALSNNIKKQISDFLDHPAVSPLLSAAGMTSADKNDLKNINLTKEITSIDHNSEDLYITPEYNGKQPNNPNFKIKFPLGEQSRISSLLSLGEVSKIEYNAADKTSFYCEMRYKDANTGEYGRLGNTYDIEAPSITIYMKDERAYELPDDQTKLSHGKVFNMDIDTNAEYKGLDDSLIDSVEEIGGKADLTGTFQSIDFKGSYIKVFFNNNPKSANYGKPIYIDYHLNYSVNVYTYMMLYLKYMTAEIDISDYFTLATTFNERTQFYMIINT